MLKVMIAEDDLMMADMLEDVLVTGGYEVCGIARTVDKGVELGERHKPDLAVLDLRLAEGGLGTEIAARLNRQGSLGVLYASGNAGQMGLTKADGEACLGKPYRPEDVVRALKIVEQIVSTGEASQPFPKGFRVLNGSSKSDAVPKSANVELVKRQQAALARFGRLVLSESDLGKVLTEAARVCAEGLDLGTGLSRTIDFGASGSISVSLSSDQSADNATIIFADDGVGFAEDSNTKRHGLQLVKRLMEQVCGSATLHSFHGAEWTLKFPVPTIP